MVGQQVLVLFIGVRIPASEPTNKILTIVSILFVCLCDVGFGRPTFSAPRNFQIPTSEQYGTNRP